MCFKPKTPDVVRIDPKAEAEKAAAEAAVAANADAANRRTTRRMSALSTGAGLGSVPATGSALGYGKTTLGG